MFTVAVLAEAQEYLVQVLMVLVGVLELALIARVEVVVAVVAVGLALVAAAQLRERMAVEAQLVAIVQAAAWFTVRPVAQVQGEVEQFVLCGRATLVHSLQLA